MKAAKRKDMAKETIRNASVFRPGLEQWNRIGTGQEA
jgi:hypothetical protein